MSESQRKTVFCEKVHTHARHGPSTSSSHSVEEWEGEVSVHEVACHFHLLHFWGTDTSGAGATCSSSTLSSLRERFPYPCSSVIIHRHNWLFIKRGHEPFRACVFRFTD